MFHIFLHFAVPALLVGLLTRNPRTHRDWLGGRWRLAYLILMATMLVDVDHLLANPIYDPNRCSIGFHPLHQLWLIGLYILLCFIPKTRLIGLGLTIHMALDSIDCQLTNGI
ncbi:DUF6122 family protein [Porticoccaceae bacterium]|nr:DUF6122 family protein [Porticoccaceae bacterium]MDC0010496.1 DUF6122 family protein [Porticoccaceae bacterium]